MEGLLTELSEILLPYKEVVAKSAITVTVLQLLTPALLVNDIRKAGSTKNFSIAPFLGGGILSVMFIIFGQMVNDSATIKVNLIGVALSVTYIAAFYFYTPVNEKFSVWIKIGVAGAISAALVAYTQYEDPDLVEQRFGIITTLFLYALIASPMVELKHVIRNKSTEGLPFPLIFMGFVVSTAWLIYGIILNNIFMVFQNIVAVLLGGFQLSFFLIYPSKKVEAKKKKQ